MAASLQDLKGCIPVKVERTLMIVRVYLLPFPTEKPVEHWACYFKAAKRGLKVM